MSLVTVDNFTFWLLEPKDALHHKLLGIEHSDVEIEDVVRGDLILGNKIPKWDRISLGTADEILGTDGTDVLWRSLAEAGIQAQDAVLDDLSALAVVALNEFIVGTGAGTYDHKTVAEVGAILEADMDHGNIQGLADDDHTQYHLTDGTRVHTGDLQIQSDNVAKMESQNRFRHLNTMARVRMTSAQTISTATVTAIAWDGTEEFDTDTLHSTSTNPSRITAAIAGKYIVTGVLSYTGNATGTRLLRAHVNGSPIGDFAQVAGFDTNTVTLSGNVMVDLAATDYVEILAFQNSGGDLDVRSEDSHFQMAYLGE